jgi:hypothetical protein
VFWPLKSNSEVLGVSKDSQVPHFGSVSFILTLSQSRVATIWGRNEVFILSSDLVHFHKVRQNLLGNFGFQSDTMSLGRPWCLNTCMKNNLPVSWAVALFLGGNEVCHLAKSINHHHDRIKSPLMVVNSPWNPWTHFPTALQESVMVVKILLVSY